MKVIVKPIKPTKPFNAVPNGGCAHKGQCRRLGICTG